MKILIRYIFMVNILFFNLFTIVYSEDNKENKENDEKKGFQSVLDNRFFSIGLIL